MVKIGFDLSEENALMLEELIDEISDPNWTVERRNDPVGWSACGYFDSAEDAAASLDNLRTRLPFLPEASAEPVVETDWKNAYKAYLQPWSCGNLHWVPVWMKDSYSLPKGDKVFYFDAQMAFGTGDHPTTRLCAQALQRYISETPDYADKELIDAGCGSGILAVSAALLGFRHVKGFDIDPDAVLVSRENSRFSNAGLPDEAFWTGGLAESLPANCCDVLLANILANVLVDNAEILSAAVRDGGVLVLSGILKTEADSVKAVFEKSLSGRIESARTDFMGEWASIEFRLKR